jgi:hypothetical protein
MPQTKNSFPISLKCLLIAAPIGLLLNSPLQVQEGMAKFVGWTALAWALCMLLAAVIFVGGKLFSTIRNSFSKRNNQRFHDVDARPMADERTCPYCCEQIKGAAVICRYCRSALGNMKSGARRSKLLVGSLSVMLALATLNVSSAFSDVDARTQKLKHESNYEIKSLREELEQLSD